MNYGFPTGFPLKDHKLGVPSKKRDTQWVQLGGLGGGWGERWGGWLALWPLVCCSSEESGPSQVVRLRSPTKKFR